MRVFFFRPVHPAQFIPSFDQVIALLVTLLAVVAILDRVTAGVDAEFNIPGVYTWIAILLIGLLDLRAHRAIHERTRGHTHAARRRTRDDPVGLHRHDSSSVGYRV